MTNRNLQIFDGSTQGEAYAKARRALGPGMAFIWRKPNGVMLALRTDSAEETPVVQKVAYYHTSSDNPYLEEKRTKEAQDSALKTAVQEYTIQARKNYYTCQPAQPILIQANKEQQQCSSI